MKSFELERWDDGRLTVNRDFAGLLSAHGLTTFEAVWNRHGEVAKNLLRERTTERIVLDGRESEQGVEDRAPGAACESTERPPTAASSQSESCSCLALDPGPSTLDPSNSQLDTTLYLKRHTRPPFKEYVKPWLRLTRPILGAANEWNAILQFHAAGIPTMTPVALGQSGGRSFLLTEELADCRKLSHWFEDDVADDAAAAVLDDAAELARRMHSSGMHHQDFYLTHLMLPADYPQRPLHVIDLGRVQKRRRLGTRWIVKDLSQFRYSASMLSRQQHDRFIERYLGHPPTPADNELLSRVDRKAERIARHSSKNGL